MKEINGTMQFNKNAESLGAVHTHMCGFKSIKNNAIFAFINNIKRQFAN